MKELDDLWYYVSGLEKAVLIMCAAVLIAVAIMVGLAVGWAVWG